MPKADSITGGTLGSIDIYECPHCHEKFEMKWGSFINHIRWCKKNPNKNDIKETFFLVCSLISFLFGFFLHHLI